ncbi:MAG: pirin family protein [Gammaproteobacteria bacterium]|nr:pirin family protein [Gammaproteobacteria bacterium]
MSYTIRDIKVVPEGDGVDVKRLFPLNGFMNFDPFVLWDHFEVSPGRGFPDHPHRGFEAITYMFKGGMNHKDNLGNESFVTSGGAQRFTAGKGIIHSEMPAEIGNSNGIQLWINLPGKLKQMSASYQQVNHDEFPVQIIPGGKVKVIVGEGSPLILNTQVSYMHISLEKQAEYNISFDKNMRGILYLMQGELNLDSIELKHDKALFIESQDSLRVISQAKSEFMLCLGLPHYEPIHQYGPFVD